MNNINIEKGRASMMYFGELPWHGLGQKLDNPATSAEAIAAAGLDFAVHKIPLRYDFGGKMIEARDSFATVRADNGKYLGTVGAQYKIIQNRDAFEAIDNLVGSKDAMYHTAGALGDGERIWILAKLPDYIKIRDAKDSIEKYFLLATSHDGTISVIMKTTPIRVVCNNTLSAALAGFDQTFKIRHTTNAESKMKQAFEALNIVNSLYTQLDQIFNQMALRKITNKELLAYVKNLIPDPTDEESSKTKAENMRSEVLELVEVGAGSNLVSSKGTLWGAYNGFTEAVDHVVSEKFDANRHASSVMFGNGMRKKDEAFKLAVSMLSPVTNFLKN